MSTRIDDIKWRENRLSGSAYARASWAQQAAPLPWLRAEVLPPIGREEETGHLPQGRRGHIYEGCAGVKGILLTGISCGGGRPPV
jgi:hypothetical protein